MQFLKIKNWERHQHYKDRDPKWIKLYQDLLTSQTWVVGDDASRTLAVALMLLAAKTGNRIPMNSAYIKRVAYLNAEPDFSSLLATDFIEIIEESGSASDVLAERYQEASLEKRREEKKREEKKESLSLPDWVPEDAWKAWLEVRPKVKAPNTPKALGLALKELDRLRADGNDPRTVLEQATLKGWRGLFPVNGGSGPQPIRTDL